MLICIDNCLEFSQDSRQIYEMIKVLKTTRYSLTEKGKFGEGSCEDVSSYLGEQVNYIHKKIINLMINI